MIVVHLIVFFYLRCHDILIFFQLPCRPPNLVIVWGSWRASLRQSVRVMGELVVKALVWNIWLARNDCMFNAIVISAHTIILKINRMLLSWFAAADEGTQEKFEDLVAIIRRSLDFLNPRGEEAGHVPTVEENLEQSES